MYLCEPGRAGLEAKLKGVETTETPSSSAPATIRLAVLADAAAMTRLHVRAIRRTASERYSPRQVEVWSGRIRADTHHPVIADRAAWVAEVDGVVVGFVSLTRETSTLNLLYVDPEYGRRGIGLALALHAVDQAKREGMSELKVSASHLSLPVFLRAGFVMTECLCKSMGGLEFECFAMVHHLD